MIWGLSNSNIQIVPMKYNPRDENSVKAVMAKANVVINLIGNIWIFDFFVIASCNWCGLIILFKQEGNTVQEITALRKWTITWLNSLLLYVSICWLFLWNYDGSLFHYFDHLIATKNSILIKPIFISLLWPPNC